MTRLQICLMLTAGIAVVLRFCRAGPAKKNRQGEDRPTEKSCSAIARKHRRQRVEIGGGPRQGRAGRTTGRARS